MIGVRDRVLVACVASLTLLTAVAAQQPVATPRPALTDQQQEAFLLKAKVVRWRATNVGVTNSRRATLTDGPLTHDAHIQSIDQFKPVFSSPAYSEVGFRDSYKYNIAAYRLARLLGLENVPVSVERTVDGSRSSVTWWVDAVMMDEGQRRGKGVNDPDIERAGHYLSRMRVFDELILNRDRNQGNILFSSDWTMWLIDHTRAFRVQKELVNPQTLQRIERQLFESLQALTPQALSDAVGGLLARTEQQGLIARRDLIVAHFKARIVEAGEERTVYSYSR